MVVVVVIVVMVVVVYDYDMRMAICKSNKDEVQYLTLSLIQYLNVLKMFTLINDFMLLRNSVSSANLMLMRTLMKTLNGIAFTWK
jgi:hypothetical protein